MTEFSTQYYKLNHMRKFRITTWVHFTLLLHTKLSISTTCTQIFRNLFTPVFPNYSLYVGSWWISWCCRRCTRLCWCAGIQTVPPPHPEAVLTSWATSWGWASCSGTGTLRTLAGMRTQHASLAHSPSGWGTAHNDYFHLCTFLTHVNIWTKLLFLSHRNVTRCEMMLVMTWCFQHWTTSIYSFFFSTLSSIVIINIHYLIVSSCLFQ